MQLKNACYNVYYISKDKFDEVDDFNWQNIKIRSSHVRNMLIDGHRNLKGICLYMLYSDFNRRWKTLIIVVSDSSI